MVPIGISSYSTDTLILSLLMICLGSLLNYRAEWKSSLLLPIYLSKSKI